MSLALHLVWGFAGATAGWLHACALWAQASGRGRAGVFTARALAVIAFFSIAIRAQVFVAPVGWALGLLATAARLVRASEGAP